MKINEKEKKYLENKIIKIWRTILNNNKINKYDNFYEVGGDSLLIIKIISKIKKDLNINLSIEDVLNNPSIDKLIYLISQQKKIKKDSYFLSFSKKDSVLYNLSDVQKRIFYMKNIVNDFSFFNLTYIKKIKNEIDIKNLKKAIEVITKKQALIRSNFKKNKHYKPLIFINKNKPCNFKIIKIKEYGAEKKIIKKISKKHFDLEKDCLFKIYLIIVNKNKKYFVINTHHIVADLWSIKLFLDNLFEIYFSLKNSKTFLSQKGAEYSFFVKHESERKNTKQYIKQEKYWLKALKGDLPKLNIDTDYLRPSINDYNGSYETIFIDNCISEKIRKFCAKQNVTPFVFFFSVFGIFLHYFSGQKDIIIGTYDSGRNNEKFANIIGPMINNLPLRINFLKDRIFLNYINYVKKIVINGIKNSTYSFEELMEKLNIKRDVNRSPVFDVVFQIFNEDLPCNKKNIFRNKVIKNNLKTNSSGQFDLVFQIINDKKRGFKFILEYKTSLYKKKTILNYLNYIKNLSKEIIYNYNLKISELKQIKFNEKESVISGPKKKFTKLNNIWEIVAKKENSVSIFDKNIKYKFEDLFCFINLATAFLINNRIKKGDKVFLSTDRSIFSLALVLAVLRIGAVNVLVELNTPNQRVKRIIKDSDAKLAIFNKNSKINDKNFFFIESIFKKKYKFSKKIFKNISLDDPAFIFYTSGSCGYPKGVVLSHRAIINHVYTKIVAFNIKKNDRICWNLSIGFVAFLWQIFAPLFKGCSLYIYPLSLSYDSISLFNNIKKDNISILEVSPAFMNDYFNCLKEKKVRKIIKSLRLVSLGGEPLSSKLLKNFFVNFSTKLINSYGQTEYPGSAYPIEISRFKNSNSIPIGYPAPNTKFLVLNENMEVVPNDIIGELYVSGDGIFSEYIKKNNVKTFFIIGGLKYEFFSTGDLVKKRKDGYLDYVGRKDDRININGNRVELNEIKKVLERNDEIIQSVVTFSKKGLHKNKIVSFYKVRKNKNIAEINIRRYVKKFLPTYMIPSYFFQVETIPMNKNGKIDLKNLKKVKFKKESFYEKIELSKTENELLTIWKKILNKKNVTIYDNFFEIGGDSLKLMKFLKKIKQKINKDVDIMDLFYYPNIKDLYSKIKKLNLHNLS
jgi:acyl-coenzyme A synthetase/AMP-(fatty) acid ligase/acyl carrier protein